MATRAVRMANRTRAAVARAATGVVTGSAWRRLSVDQCPCAASSGIWANRVNPSSASAAVDAAAAQVAAITQTENLGGGDPKTIASALLSSFGWSGSQFGCLVSLWNRESGWRTTAANPSGAYGIPQALPGSKMASAGPNWQTDAETQIKWGLGYIAARYGSPCGAWGHSQATGWY